jgi:uncharacterized membrane protein YdbT with pleckstrin-like domain
MMPNEFEDNHDEFEDNHVDEDEIILQVQPSWWNFFWHLVFFFLIVPLIIALWQRASLKIKVYSDRIVFEKGVLSKDVKEIFCADVRTIDVRQSFWQRIIGIGDIALATSGTSGYEEEAHGIPDPMGLKDVIYRQKREHSK